MKYLIQGDFKEFQGFSLEFQEFQEIQRDIEMVSYEFQVDSMEL